MPDLREDIRQRKPFTTLEQEAQLSVVRTASLLVDAFEQMLKPYGITATQYNVLRILRGAELVSRSRSSEDRRLVSTRITPKGLRLLDELEDAVAEEHMRRFHHLSKTELKALIELLKGVRERLSLHGPQA
jgi:hypothetical protein